MYSHIVLLSTNGVVSLFQNFKPTYLQLLMKISMYTALSGLMALALAVRPSQAAPSFLPVAGVKGVRQDRRVKSTSSNKDKTSGGGGGGSTSAQSVLFDDSQCFICTPENKIRPASITVQYYGGVGQISQYQDEDKATCRGQTFPESGTVTVYGQSYDVSTGDVFTFTNPDGEMDAETDFTFSNAIECFIHTSCSQPLTAGDQIGPFLLLQGNDCEFINTFCGDNEVNGDEICDEGDAMPCTYRDDSA